MLNNKSECGFMAKKMFIVTFALFTIFQNVQAQPHKKKIMNNNIVIAFDLHEVVFSFSYSRFFNAVYNFFVKTPYALSLANPIFGYRIAHTLYYNSNTAENIYNKLSVKHYPWLSDSKKEFLNVCNSYILDPEMKRLLDELKKEGYRLAVCSNIGQEAFEHFKNEHAETFQMFEVIVTSHPQREYLRKPAHEFFDHFKKDVQKVFPEANYYIFIDDKPKNALAAQKLGIQGIVFKNPTQLRKALKELGVRIAD